MMYECYRTPAAGMFCTSTGSRIQNSSLVTYSRQTSSHHHQRSLSGIWTLDSAMTKPGTKSGFRPRSISYAMTNTVIQDPGTFTWHSGDPKLARTKSKIPTRLQASLRMLDFLPISSDRANMIQMKPHYSKIHEHNSSHHRACPFFQ